jgi:diguanylate cyclase (GGDEF)-like protein
MTILIVDDSRVVQRHLQAVLARAGYTDVLTAQSAREAFAHLGINAGTPPDGAGGAGASARDIDLILLDVVMPEMNGVEVCRRIKSAAHLRDIPVIMVTGQTEISNLAAGFAAGAMDYITKPSNEVELLARVRSALKLKQEIDRRKAREQELLDLAAQLEEANRRLERLSSLDGLTGIPNRRRFDEYLQLAWRQAIHGRTPLSLLLIDIDYFKLFNDTYGHQQGDDCLRQVAGAITASVTDAGDLVARYGGEEFAVILPDASSTRAALVAETVRARVRGLNIPHARSAVSERVTVSVGAATALPAGAMSPALLVAEADQALYCAKHEGRNCVRLWEIAAPPARVWSPHPGALPRGASSE